MLFLEVLIKSIHQSLQALLKCTSRLVELLSGFGAKG
uniref:Uncharacterized protein n=1 Tax=Anguilla anguilla TaxID=7936 RepID=A0A0E9UNX5_ANGAN